jgi:hypothetical protein
MGKKPTLTKVPPPPKDDMEPARFKADMEQLQLNSGEKYLVHMAAIRKNDEKLIIEREMMCGKKSAKRSAKWFSKRVFNSNAVIDVLRTTVPPPTPSPSTPPSPPTPSPSTPPSPPIPSPSTPPSPPSPPLSPPPSPPYPPPEHQAHQRQIQAAMSNEEIEQKRIAFNIRQNRRRDPMSNEEKKQKRIAVNIRRKKRRDAMSNEEKEH